MLMIVLALCLFACILTAITFWAVSAKKQIVSVSSIVIMLLILIFVPSPLRLEGLPKTNLANNTTYIKGLEARQDNFYVLGLWELDKDEPSQDPKKMVFYRISASELVNNLHQPINALPDKFKILKDKTDGKRYYILVKAD
jgi:hypothetical protein